MKKPFICQVLNFRLNTGMKDLLMGANSSCDDWDTLLELRDIYISILKFWKFMIRSWVYYSWKTLNGNVSKNTSEKETYI